MSRATLVASLCFPWLMERSRLGLVGLHAVVEHIQSTPNGRVLTSLDTECRIDKSRRVEHGGRRGRPEHGVNTDEQSNGRGHRARRVEESGV